MNTGIWNSNDTAAWITLNRIHLPGIRMPNFIALLMSVFAYRGRYASLAKQIGLGPVPYDPARLQPISAAPEGCKYDPVELVSQIWQQGIDTNMATVIEDLCRTHLSMYKP